MLNANKVKLVFELIDFVIDVHNKGIRFDNDEYKGFRMESNDSENHDYKTDTIQKTTSTVLKELFDTWYFIALHPCNDFDRASNSRILRSSANHITCSYTPIDWASTRLMIDHCITGDSVQKYEPIFLDDIECTLFQLQTEHNDYVALALIVEAYVIDKVDSFYLPINLTKILNTDENMISLLLEYYTHKAYSV